MRHGKKFNHLGRKTAHRKALLANMAISLIEHKRIKTTLAKAKALRTYVEPLITKSKTDTTHSRRVVFSYLNNKEALKELFGEVASAVAERPGGYTRILKLGTRTGDNAEMALIELVDFNEFGANTAAKASRRRRRRGKKKSESTPTETVEEVVADTTETFEEAEIVEEVEEAVAEVEEAVEEEAVEGEDESAEDEDKKS
jgi:large subunit ribosomal protein L17